ncbi:MAG: hypothetical protein ACUVT7_08315 [Thermoplasmata archaeon]
MLFRNQRYPDAFAKELNQRWRAEAYFSKMKRRFSPSLTSRTGTMRRREVWIRTIFLNTLVLAGEEAAEELKVAG